MRRSDWLEHPEKDVFVEISTTEMIRVQHWLKQLCITCVEEKK